MLLARIQNDTIIELRNISLDDVPAHKRQHWRPIEGTPPSHDPEIDTISGPTYVIEAGRVLRQYTIARRPQHEIDEAVRREYERRRCLVFDASDIARAAASQADDNAEIRILYALSSRTPEQQAWLDEMIARGSRAMALVDRFNAILEMSPVPSDYRSDIYWS